MDKKPPTQRFQSTTLALICDLLQEFGTSREKNLLDGLERKLHGLNQLVAALGIDVPILDRWIWLDSESDELYVYVCGNTPSAYQSWFRFEAWRIDPIRDTTYFGRLGWLGDDPARGKFQLPGRASLPTVTIREMRSRMDADDYRNSLLNVIHSWVQVVVRMRPDDQPETKRTPRLPVPFVLRDGEKVTFPKLMSVADAATLCNVSPETVIAWIHRRNLPASNLAARSDSRPLWRIKGSDLDAFLTKRKLPILESIPLPQTRRVQNSGAKKWFG